MPDAPSQARRQVLADSYYLLRVCTLLMHPIVPRGCEAICNQLGFDAGEFFNWRYDFDSMDELCSDAEVAESRHKINELPPRFDFFKKHESQYK
jgi:methionyl-tRNA synthetase